MPNDETFGFDRLTAVLRTLPARSNAEAISAAILHATDEFSGCPAEAHDDRTLLILRLTSGGGPQPSAIKPDR